jgi:TusA-related sulfurtransferase
MSDKYCDKQIDLRGLKGTETVIRTKIEIDRLAVGKILRVISDDSESEEEISRLITRSGHEIISSTGSAEEGEFDFLIRKAD